MNMNELQRVIASVQDWPAEDRIVLARKILETIEDSSKEGNLRLRGEEVIRVLNMPQPAATDEQCSDIVAEQRMRKYGG